MEDVVAQVTISGTPARIADVGTQVLVQNLGPGVLYVGAGGLTAANGVQVPVGRSVTLSGGGSVWGVSTDSSDVRFQAGVTGIYASISE